LLEARAAAAALVFALALPAQASDEAYLEVARTILCDCGCHPQSVHACACGRAAQMRDEIAAALLRGGPGGTPQTAAQVIASYVARHGEKIRIAPTTRGFNLVAWLGPFVGLVAAGIAVLFALRRWRGAAQPVALPAEAGPDLDPAYLQRLQRELRDER
jgi:cytochrome c-type biogenesis protein CcmH